MTKTQTLVRQLFKNDDNQPFELTDSQDRIFQAIFKRLYPRLFVCTYTQFGKSDVISLAILARLSSMLGKVAIVAPSNKKAQIIMGYLVGHIFDNPITKGAFQIGPDESLERIQRERNKAHLTFRTPNGISEVMTISAEGRRTKDILNALLGFGARDVIVDESPTLSPEHYTGILRMLGGHKDNMLVEVGNAINRNHFYKASRDPMYHKIIVPYQMGITEGRQKMEYFEEMRRKMPPQIFASLYECKFPEADAIDHEGYSPLISENDLDRVQVDKVQLFGELRMGVDVAGGGRNESVIVLKGSNGARVLFKGNSNDTMSFVGRIIRLAEENRVLPANVFVDSVGIGRGVRDRLWEEHWRVTGVNFGEKAELPDYYNLRAQAFMKLGQDIQTNVLKLERHEAWSQILDIRWKTISDKRIQIIKKEQLAQRGVASPDVADSLALCYSRQRRIDVSPANRELTTEEINQLVGVYK